MLDDIAEHRVQQLPHADNAQAASRLANGLARMASKSHLSHDNGWPASVSLRLCSNKSTSIALQANAEAILRKEIFRKYVLPPPEALPNRDHIPAAIDDVIGAMLGSGGASVVGKDAQRRADGKARDIERRAIATGNEAVLLVGVAHNHAFDRIASASHTKP